MRLSESKIILIFIVLGALILGGLYIFFHGKSSTTPNSSASTPTQQSELLTRLSQGLPEAKWSQAETINESTGTYGEMEGEKITATITTSNAAQVNFNEKSYLESLGYKEDPMMAAAGPGSNVWGYSKTENGVTSVVIFSSQTKASNANENAPMEFNCPCQTVVSIFVSTPPPQSASSASTSLANPASVNCGEKGGTTEIKTLPSGAQYGLCMFDDNMACEEWALYRGECPVGGINTMGYDNESQMYCAWLGGKTLAEENATCTLPGGKVCSDDALYNGTCSTT